MDKAYCIVVLYTVYCISSVFIAISDISSSFFLSPSPFLSLSHYFSFSLSLPLFLTPLRSLNKQQFAFVVNLTRSMLKRVVKMRTDEIGKNENKNMHFHFLSFLSISFSSPSFFPLFFSYSFSHSFFFTSLLFLCHPSFQVCLP